jgi:hypothetical protein
MYEIHLGAQVIKLRKFAKEGPSGSIGKILLWYREDL